MKSKRHLFSAIAALVLIGTAVFLSYAPALDGGFVYDDPLLISENPLVSGLDSGFLDLFSTPYFGAGQAGSGYYRPLMLLIFRMEYGIYGENPFGFHLDNLLIHWGVAFCLYLLLARFGVHRGIAAAAGILFAAHPVTTESIAWISGRTDPTAFLFMGVSLLLLLGFLGGTPPDASGKRNTWFLVLSLAACGVALLVKEIAVVLPVAVLAMVFCVPRESGHGKAYGPGRLMLLVGGYAVLVVAVLVAGRLLLKGGEADLFTGQGNALARGLTFLSVIPAYMGKIFWPAHLQLARPVHLVTTVFDGDLLAGLAILLAVMGVGWYGLRKKNAAVVVGCALFLTALLAVSNLVPIVYGFREMDFPFFERYLYIPLAGMLLMIAGLIPRAGFRGWSIVPLLVALGLSVFLGRATRERSRVWHDNISLFTSGIAAYPDSPTLTFNLGQAYFDAGKLHEALAAFHRAYHLDSSLLMARVQEAITLSTLERPAEAKRCSWKCWSGSLERTGPGGAGIRLCPGRPLWRRPRALCAGRPADEQ